MIDTFRSLRSKLRSLTQESFFSKARAPKRNNHARRLGNETLEDRRLLTSITHPVVVSENPADTTPHIDLNGTSLNVHTFEQIGRTMYAGGRFSQVQDPVMTTTYSRQNFVAFDADTGVISPLNLSFNGVITAIEASADETALFISGAFSQVNGITRRGLAKYDLVNNRIDPTFAPTGMRTVSDIKLVNGELIAVGNFSKHVMAMDPTTGADLGTININVTGVVDPTDETRVKEIAISPDGTRLVATGNFSGVNGQARKLSFMLNLDGPTATLSTWYAPRFNVNCPALTRLSARGVDFSPDGSYFVIVTTGGPNGTVGLCDAAARFETANVSNRAEPTWINWTGGDTLYSVAVTGPAVYVGGHQRWMDNPFGRDFAGPGAVSRPGIAAIDPVTGRALAWNPTKSRNHGTLALFPTPDGLWVGSDGERFGGEDHAGIGFVAVDLNATPDTTRPNTFIDSGPSGLVADTSATFSFSASESATFQCRLDAAPFGPCTSSTTFDNLSLGSHTLQVVAVDSSYNMDSSPAEQTWEVVQAGSELIGNPGFESNTSGWKGASSSTLSRVVGGHSGSWAVEASAASGRCGIDESPSWVSSTEDGTYTASIWARSVTPGVTLKLRLREYDGGTRVGTVTQNRTLTSSWQQVSVDYDPVATGSRLDFEAYSTNAPAGVCFRADDASITLDAGGPPPGVTVVSGGIDVAEGGLTDSYTIVLDNAPTANVGITVNPDSQTNLGSGAGAAIVRTFTPSNWNVAQTVTVTAVDDALVEGPHTSTITHTSSSTDSNYDSLTIGDVVANITDNDTTAGTNLFLSFKSAATLPGGVVTQNEDIIAFDGTDLNVFFDGSDVGISGTNVDALAVIATDEILLSFASAENIPGIGTVQDADIVKFTAAQLGGTTSGFFELFFRGSDGGLSPTAEDIDAIDLHADGRLIVSTIGGFNVPGLSGADEDLIAFTPDSPGDYSSGTWAMYLDGSDVQLGREDVYAAALDVNGDILLSTTNSFSVTNVSGADEDVFTFVPSQLGANTSGTYASTLLFDGSQFGLAANDVNGIDISNPGAALQRGAVAAVAAPARGAELINARPASADQVVASLESSLLQTKIQRAVDDSFAGRRQRFAVVLPSAKANGAARLTRSEVVFDRSIAVDAPVNLLRKNDENNRSVRETSHQFTRRPRRDEAAVIDELFTELDESIDLLNPSVLTS